MEIEEVHTVDDAMVEAFQRLIAQLAPSAPPPTRALLDAVVASPDTVLFVARRGQEVAGTLTLVLCRLPTGLKARIEDVVVVAAYRGQGLGEALVRAGLARAEAEGAASIDLTSNPTREAANRLYQRLGFIQRQTNVYRFLLRG